jgi:outer membrane protein
MPAADRCRRRIAGRNFQRLIIEDMHLFVEGLVRKNVLGTAVAGLVVALAAATPAFAQKQRDTDIDPAHVRELVQQALQQVQPVPQPAAGQRIPFTTPGPRVDLTIQDAVQRGADKNIDIAVARITPRLTDFSLAALEANYRPNVTSSVANRSNRSPVTNQTQGATGNSLQTGTVSWQGGFAQNMKWHGGSWNVGWTNSRIDSTNLFAVRNPTYNSGITASLTQPLLRGWRLDATRAALQTNRISQQNDEISLQATVVSTQAEVRNAYWDLVFAIQAVEAAQDSVDLSTRLVQDNQARVEIGTLAPIDVVTAQAEQANRRQALVQAQATVRTSELALKRLIVSGTDDPLWTSSLNPVDRPPSTPEPINLEGAVTRALRERTDLQQSKNNLRISDINLRAQVETTRPQLDFIGSYGLSGIGGTQFIRNSQLGGAITQTIPSGYFDALNTLGRFDLPTWNVQLNFSLPLGQSAAEANVARSKLALDQSQANLKALELQIATDVANAALTVQSSLESVQATGVARELAQRRLDAAQSKFEVGMSTNYEVVQAQRDFADAQNNELRAILNYRKALVNFETAQTTGSRGVSAAVATPVGGTTTTTGTTGTGTGTSGTGSTGTGGTGTIPGGTGGAGIIGGGGGL